MAGGDDEAMEDDNDVYDENLNLRNEIVESEDEDGEDLMENIEQ